uniref:Phosphodiesterase 1C n=1 Tax=Pipistrellus kuhlii TaxID=59472 RepID=A0A7J7TPP5_PIPKU|nr:hypothetical protein mPipKuh1_013261 [Pipistrellus kuhlii]
MTDASSKKEGFKKCRSATFSIDGFSFTIVANEAGDKAAGPLNRFSRFSRSKSQSCLWNSIIDGLTGNVKEKPRPTIVHDPRPPEQILADELPQLDSPEALVKTSFRLASSCKGSVSSFWFVLYFHHDTAPYLLTTLNGNRSAYG